MLNLDYVCIEVGQNMPKGKDAQNNIRKALGILQEDGVYAMFLWLEDKGKDIKEKLVELLNKREIKKYLLDSDEDSFLNDDFYKFCEKLKVVAENLDKLLFLKKIIAHTLTYALYHAKVGE
ncbi:hypothetical protein SAMN02746089_02089 [Caldanaerobius fijiensis DSM 17918]|uniref:CRISPR type III-B/RAMP module-associated protein Cmr5 n=1 Tax=Caldanaerobius fijiensis DSM 17918 TaxID=1121256 RepID=A0A1M5CCB4_9THEO|nr:MULTISPECIES: hypothetical protein [Caldanaerobius]SHF52404.1 hypothetical protein SAMN02746089_02089 [Caldanaerobius fijiensis DSM 17918]